MSPAWTSRSGIHKQVWIFVVCIMEINPAWAASSEIHKQVWVFVICIREMSPAQAARSGIHNKQVQVFVNLHKGNESCPGCQIRNTQAGLGLLFA